MENSNNTSKIIIACTTDGVVKQVFLDTASLLVNAELPVGLHSIVAPKSLKVLGALWPAIQENFTEEHTLLTLSYNGREVDFMFSGYLLNDTILLCGNAETPPAEKALEEIMVINNEQANHIRLAEKKLDDFRKTVEQRGLSEAYLNDFSALNNELINSQRELMRKNYRIELLNKELNSAHENMTMFTYSVSHDLKEPVRMVRSFLSLLNKKYGDLLDEKGMQYMELALDGADRLSKMLADLLAYHQSAGFSTDETVDINEVISDVLQILTKDIQVSGARITCEQLPVVKGSYAGLRQVFQNIIANAIKFVPEGRKPLVSVHVEESTSTYTFSVKDNGIGIAESQKEDVFTLFRRLNTAQSYGGSGVGLAMVKKTVERMGGKVWLESAEGAGSTFYFTVEKLPEQG